MNWIDEAVEQLAVVFDDGYSRPTFGQVEYFKTALTEAKAQGAQEALAKVEEWVKSDEDKCDCDLYSREGCQHSHTDLLHYLQQLKDNKV